MFIGTSFKPRGPSFFLVCLFALGALAMTYSVVLIGAVVAAIGLLAYVVPIVWRDEKAKRRRRLEGSEGDTQ